MTESLLGSSGKVAAIGLVTAALTLAFTLWFRVALQHQSEIAAPAAHEALELNASINESLAALRGWVAYGDPESRDQRRAAWEQGIDPAAAVLQQLGRESGDPVMGATLAELDRGLRDLRRIQWAIEDVAQTPGNRPAEVEYETRLAPLRRNILSGLRDAIDQFAGTNEESAPVGIVLALARFRAAFAEGDLALNELLTEDSPARARAVREQIDLAAVRAGEVREAVAAVARTDVADLVAFVLSEFRAYRMQVASVVALERSDAHNVSKLLFEEEAQPIAEHVRTLSRDFAETQSHASEASARGLTRASYGVIALSLVMGLLSAGSLFVSFRLRRQVEQVMDKAKALGQYVVEARLGTGGMGEVFLAHHAMLRRPTAIKLLRAGSTQDLRAQERFQREVRLTSQLTHPNTIEIFDYGRTPEGVFYYAMEYLEGFTLETLVRQLGPVEPARVVHILLQACGSLGEAHARGLLHRDVKPNNMMLTERGGVFDTLKLLDFGLAKNVEEGGGEADSIAGTPMYIAPEVILAPDASSAQTDLYALGAVGYYLLTGETIFPAGTTLEVFERHLTEEVEFPSRRLGRPLPEDLETVIVACLAKDPGDRPQGAAGLAAMLRATTVGGWSERDAELWWQEYGEALRTASSQSGESTQRTGLEIEVGTTRS